MNHCTCNPSVVFREPFHAPGCPVLARACSWCGSVYAASDTDPMCGACREGREANRAYNGGRGIIRRLQVKAAVGPLAP